MRRRTLADERPSHLTVGRAPDTAGGVRTALVLSGGGARGAYQVGVLRGLVNHGFLPRDHAGIDILVGSSAGALNVAAVASFADDFSAGVDRLVDLWSGIAADKVFRTDVGTLGRNAARWALDLSFGGVTRHVRAQSLLDTTPLSELLHERLPLDRIAQHIDDGTLAAVAVLATDLHTGNGVVFLDAHGDVPLWTRRRWRIERTRLRVPHLMASSAIPVFFPPIEIDGGWFSDGSIRNTAPLSPAINLGADRIIAIGVSGPAAPAGQPIVRKPPTVGQVAGVLLDAVMLDAIEVDVEHGERVNESVLMSDGLDGHPFRTVRVLWLRPSFRVRQLAADMADRIPPIVRYLMRGLGSDESMTELASYLLFDGEFCRRLMALGEADVTADVERIEGFFA